MTEQYAWVNAVGEVAVTIDGEAPEHGSWERLVPENDARNRAERRISQLQTDQLEILQKIASALNMNQLTPGHLPTLILDEIEIRRVGAEQQQAWLKQIATALGLDGSGIISNPRPLIAAIDDLRSKMMTDWSKQVGQNDYEVITELADIMGCDGTASDVLKTAKRWTKLRHWLDEVIKASGHAPEITITTTLIERVLGSIKAMRHRVGEQMEELRAEEKPRYWLNPATRHVWTGTAEQEGAVELVPGHLATTPESSATRYWFDPHIGQIRTTTGVPDSASAWLELVRSDGQKSVEAFVELNRRSPWMVRPIEDGDSDGGRDWEDVLATELYRMVTGSSELPNAHPSTTERYRRGARAILAATKR